MRAHANSNRGKGQKMKRMMLAGICLVLMVACIGCNTIRGLGEDLTAVGGWVVKGADKVEEGK
jgi:predicted small secreted protein